MPSADERVYDVLPYCETYFAKSRRKKVLLARIETLENCRFVLELWASSHTIYLPPILDHEFSPLLGFARAKVQRRR